MPSGRLVWGYRSDSDKATMRVLKSQWTPNSPLFGVSRCKLLYIILYRMDKQQGPTVEHRELYTISCDKP